MEFGPERKNCKDVIFKYKKRKNKRELNWKPKLSLNQTVSFTIDWYKSFFEVQKMQNFSSEQIENYMEYK